MHPFSILTVGIFVAGYITARWDLVTRLYELAIFAWDHGVVTRAVKGFAFLSIFFFIFILPIDRIAFREVAGVCMADICAGTNRLILLAPKKRFSRYLR
jgi:phosphatidylinositol glycan class Q protein